MLLLVYEYLTGGGLWSDQTSDTSHHPLLGEGLSMVEAISEDLDQIDGIEVVQLRDQRYLEAFPSTDHSIAISSQAHELEQLAYWGARAEGTILIAPESGGRLLQRCRVVTNSGGQLLSPDPTFVALASNKHATAQQLDSAGVGTPEAQLVTNIGGFSVPPCEPERPWVLKPNDGFGSLDTYLCQSAQDWDRLTRGLAASECQRWRLERFHAGLPVSVAALCGPRGTALLPPCLQRISQDGQFAYLGGYYPLSIEQSQRACRLARQALDAMPPTTGYVGIDMVLGDSDHATPDVVLDINPRLTTSYVGLRRATSCNLAQAMLTIARGGSHPLFFQPDDVEFDCQGHIAQR